MRRSPAILFYRLVSGRPSLGTCRVLSISGFDVTRPGSQRKCFCVWAYTLPFVYTDEPYRFLLVVLSSLVPVTAVGKAVLVLGGVRAQSPVCPSSARRFAILAGFDGLDDL